MVKNPGSPALPAPKIVIVGGVAGGASAAARARRLNERATIVMFERDEHVSFANCGLPYYLGGEITDRDKLLIATPALFRDRFRVDARIREEVVAIDRAGDVREPAEIATLPLSHAPHAINIRLNELRDRLGELDPSRPTVVSCRSGPRSHLALRMLVQHGFAEVYNLSGAAAMRDFAMNPRSGAAPGTPVDLPCPQHFVDED